MSNPANPPSKLTRIAVLCPGPSLKTSWNDGKAKEFDAVVAVTTAAWRYRCDWLVASDAHVFNPEKLRRLPCMGYVTHDNPGNKLPLGGSNGEGMHRRSLPIGAINSPRLTPDMAQLAKSQGMGQCGWSMPNAVRFAHEEWPGCEVVI